MFEEEAKERARKLKENQTLGVYDNDEDLARDEGWNDGEVAGYEKGFQEGAALGYNKGKEEQKHNTHTVAHLNDCISEAQNKKIEELKAQIEQLTYLHNEDVSTVKLLNKQIEKMKECANCPVWLLNQVEKNCKDCEHKEALILLRR